MSKFRTTAIAIALCAGSALAAAPALVLYAAWRWYVLSHFAAGELKPLPFAQWQFANIPLILRSMLKDMLEKGYFFATAALAVAGLIWRLRRHGLDVPVLLLDGTVVCRHRLDRHELARLLRPGRGAHA